MRFKIKYVFPIMVGVCLSLGCKKQLELQPTDSFSEANAFQTINDVQLGVSEAYRRYGDAYVDDMYASALVSDEAKLGLDNAGQGALTYRYQYSSDATTGGDVVSAWGDFYALIDQINRVLPKIATVKASAAEEPKRNILQGQLLALRGIALFDLLENYSKVYDPNDPLGVPIELKSDPLQRPARNKVSEVITQIETDLTTAKGLVPASFYDTVMNKINIAAYQARIALYKRDYASAITYSTEVISSAVKPLVSGSNFAGIWSDNNSFETLFRVRYSNSPIVGNLWNTTAGQIYIAPSDKLVSTYAASDIRLSTFIGTNSGGNNFVKKFDSSSRGANVVDLKACRISEMYLIRAEAYAKSSTPNITAGAADLNLLRSNRITGYTNEIFASASDLITAVLNERFKELCFEGFRLYDLKRNNLPVQRFASDANPAWQNLAANSYLFVFPIPKTELNANPNMVQNAGY